MQNARSYLKFFYIFLLMITSSCLSRYENHGFMFQDIEKEAVTQSVSDKKQVLSVLGSPSFILKDKNSEKWVYFS